MTTPADSSRPHPPSGDQFEIRSGAHAATIVEVGGGLRECRLSGSEVLDGYGLDERCTGARGLPLIPWPNRLEDGKYRFDGAEYQVPLTEPAKHNAIHGFLRWRNWTCRERSQDRVVMGTVLHPLKGYPFTLDVSVEYHLGAEGLTVTTRSTNVGRQPCPYASGQHPYVTVGTPTIDACRLEIDAAAWLPTDERGLPTGRRAVAGSPYDFRQGREIGSQEVDYAFVDLRRDGEGRAWVHVTGPDGRRVSVWVDGRYPFVEIYTAHTQPAPHWRTGLGIEPMTCAPNGFRSGDGLITLEPGETTTAAWGLRAS
ncbi:MAG TPA: aldose 1-epimerase family protein [Vicinamibacterales bacterium]|jgi:aldose 1-epimerase